MLSKNQSEADRCFSHHFLDFSSVKQLIITKMNEMLCSTLQCYRARVIYYVRNYKGFHVFWVLSHFDNHRMKVSIEFPCPAKFQIHYLQKKNKYSVHQRWWEHFCFVCLLYFMLALKCYHILQSNQNADLALYCIVENTKLYLQTKNSQQMTQDGLGWKHNNYMTTLGEVSEPGYSTDIRQIPSKTFANNVRYLGSLIGNPCFLRT